jgi:signal transduction histidine kinase
MGKWLKRLPTGKTRFFVEISGDYPEGIRQIVVPVKNQQSEIIAAIMFEYTPLYNEMIEAAKPSMYIIVGTTAVCIVLSLAAGYGISQTISQPLRAVTDVAKQVTDDENFNLQAEVKTRDEIGTLATAFNQLIHRVQELLTEKEMRAQELAQANQKLISTQKQMIAQEKLASLGSLTAGIAHEIQNPLNFVNNFAELSVELTDELTEEIEARKEELDGDFVEDMTEIVEMLKSNVSKIENHGKRADKIVANMLMHSRSGQSEWAIADINELVSEAINLAYHGMRAKQSDFNVEFDRHYDETIGQMKVSPQNLNRVFLNIANNACYAVYQRQKQEGSDFKPQIKVQTSNLKETIEVRMRDNGIGMTPEVQEKVFDQFFTTKPTGEGTGLGLSLSYNIIVDQHQGTIDVKSEPGVYAEFIVTLPKQIT